MSGTEGVTTRGGLLKEGKTKRVYWHLDDPQSVEVEIKDDLTAGNGAKHDVLAGKSTFANTVICNVFALLKQCGIPMAFQRKLNATSFLARNCEMLPFEVVTRREVHGSARGRYPFLPKRYRFERLRVEFFLKTSNLRWKNHNLPCDDPFMKVTDSGVELYNPAVPFFGSTPFLVLDKSEVEGLEHLPEMAELAGKSFLVLEKAWAMLGYTYLDDKKEFGLVQDTVTGDVSLLLSDDIEPSSWRILAPDGKYFDKQYYRDGGDVEGMLAIYEKTAALTSAFRILNQQLVLWRGSDKDKFDAFDQAIDEFRALSPVALASVPTIRKVTRSFHKQPELALKERSEAITENPNSAFIAHIGLSNAAASVLAAGLSVPVVTVPKGLEDHHETVWSSLENPSAVPSSVIVRPSNAVLFVLQHFAASNPLIYMALRHDQEKRMVNTTVPF